MSAARPASQPASQPASRPASRPIGARRRLVFSLPADVVPEAQLTGLTLAADAAKLALDHAVADAIDGIKGLSRGNDGIGRAVSPVSAAQEDPRGCVCS